jgi:hypothetical protein
MRMRNYKYENNDINSDAGQISLPRQIPANRSKFNSSMEKKIERIWLQSQQLGWSYNDFVVHLLEVLVVLQKRNKATPVTVCKKSINGEITS